MSFDAPHQPFTSVFSVDFPNNLTGPLKVSVASFVSAPHFPGNVLRSRYFPVTLSPLEARMKHWLFRLPQL